MKVLSTISASILVCFGAVEMSSVIILCYILAVTHGHVKPWLPTISACGEHPPEQYPFRFGIMLGAMLLFVEAVALHAAKWGSKVTFILGAVAAVCLGIVAAVAANEDNIVHTTAAVIFFVFEDIMSVLLTFDLVGRITRLSVLTKTVSATVACVATIGRLMILSNQFTISDNFPALAIVEWSNTAAITVYQLSLANDVSHLSVGVIDTSQNENTKQVSTGSSTTSVITPAILVSSPAESIPKKKPELIMQLERAEV